MSAISSLVAAGLTAPPTGGYVAAPVSLASSTAPVSTSSSDASSGTLSNASADTTSGTSGGGSYDAVAMASASNIRGTNLDTIA